MTRYEIAKLACRILAVWLFCQTALTLYAVVFLLVFSVPQFISSGLDAGPFAGSAGAGIIGLGTALVGTVLWWKSGKIAARMTSPDATPVTSASLDHKTVMRIAFCAVGALVAIQAMPKVARPILFVLRGDFSFGELWSSSTWHIEFWTSVTQLILALWFIFGSRGIANIILRFRSLGVEKAPGSDN